MEDTKLGAEHLLRSVTLARGADVSQMFGCHPRLKQEYENTELLIFSKFVFLKLLTYPVTSLIVLDSQLRLFH